MSNDEYRPPAAPARYEHSLHVLVDEPTRALAMGLAVINSDGKRPREGESIRLLLEAQIDIIKQKAPTLYNDALTKGRAELAKRARVIAKRRKVA